MKAIQKIELWHSKKGWIEKLDQYHLQAHINLIHRSLLKILFRVKEETI